MTRALGFVEIICFKLGFFSEEITKNLVYIRTRQYAKRQRTWFRHQYHPVLVLEDAQTIDLKPIESYLKSIKV